MTLPVILYVLGAPGVGKTTLVRRLLDAYDPIRLCTEPPRPKWTYGARVAAAGYYTGQTFDGADTIPYNGAKAALDYWAGHLRDRELTILDGARFATKPSFERLKQLAPIHAIVGVHLVAPDDVKQARRDARGSNQNASWIKGATTGAANFAKHVGAFDVDASLPSEEVFNNVLDLIQRVSVSYPEVA